MIKKQTQEFQKQAESQISPTSNYSSPSKNVAISALHQDLRSSPEYSDTKDPNLNSKKLYELSEIYSTMKINDTPEDQNNSKEMFLGCPGGESYIMFPNPNECLKTQGEETMIEHDTFEEGYLQKHHKSSINLAPEETTCKTGTIGRQGSSKISTGFANSQTEHLAVIQQQNWQIEALKNEVQELKQQIKTEQREKFKLIIQIEQYKRSKPKVNKAVMADFIPMNQVRIKIYFHSGLMLKVHLN